MSKVRTRFAPSPTGDLHIGSARTALFSYLFAKRHGGSFILRIEDTDLERSTPQAINAILEGMEWLKLQADEGPYYQTQHFDRYQEVIDQMLKQGLAYKCYCSKERLDSLREHQMLQKLKPKYDGHCRNHEAKVTNQPYVVRFKNPLEENVIVEDQVHGSITFNNEELDDWIIARSDGSPTYNFCVVVDDWDMRITHVIRGDDHLNNTPKQMNLLKALGAPIPVYAHVPMILGPDGKKLSKRHGATSVMTYRDEGYLPEALLNYLVRLGWSHGDQEIFSIEEMIALFDLKDLNHSAAAINPDKLKWLNQHYLKTLPFSKIKNYLQWHLDEQKVSLAHGPNLEKVVEIQRERVHLLSELVTKSTFFYETDIEIDINALRQNLTPELTQAIQSLKQKLEALAEWSKEHIHNALARVCEEQGIKLGKLAPTIRLATTGSTASPSLDITLELLGKEKTLKRIESLLLPAHILQ